MWFLCCDDSLEHQTYVLGVFKELSEVIVRVARVYYDVPEKKLYVVRSSDEQYWLKVSDRHKGTCITERKI